MSYEEFMRELEVLLAGVPAEEREEALQYYADYFADAGKENEEAVLRDLESPQKTAALIKASLKGGDMEGGEFTEYGYTDQRFEKRDELTRREPKKEKKSQNRYSYQGHNAYSGGTFGNSSGGASGSSYSYGSGNQAYEGGNRAYNNESNMYGNAYGSNMQGNSSYGRNKPWTSKWVKILLAVLIVIFAFPVVIPVVFAVVAVVFALAFAAIAIFAGLAIGAVGVVIAGIVLICAGISKLVVIPSVALLTAGMGILIAVIGLVATVAAVRLCMLIYPALFRLLVGICRKPFHRKAGV